LVSQGKGVASGQTPFRKLGNDSMIENDSDKVANRVKQRTPKGQEIPIPKRRDFDQFVKKVAGPPAGRKRPAETDRPREQSD
jgi:hypothetical protein